MVVNKFQIPVVRLFLITDAYSICMVQDCVFFFHALRWKSGPSEMTTNNNLMDT